MPLAQHAPFKKKKNNNINNNIQIQRSVITLKFKKSWCNWSWNRPRVSQPGSHKQNKSTTTTIMRPQTSYLQDVVSLIEKVITAWCLILFPHSRVTHWRTGTHCWECGDDYIIILPAHTLPFFRQEITVEANGFKLYYLKCESLDETSLSDCKLFIRSLLNCTSEILSIAVSTNESVFFKLL